MDRRFYSYLKIIQEKLGRLVTEDEFFILHQLDGLQLRRLMYWMEQNHPFTSHWYNQCAHVDVHFTGERCSRPTGHSLEVSHLVL